HEIACPVGHGVAGIVVEREPDLCLGRWEAEICRHYAQNFAPLTLDLNLATDHRPIAGETFLPEGVAQDHEAILACGVFGGMEYSSKFWCCAEYRKELGGDFGRSQAYRFANARQVELVPLGIGCHIERAHLVAHGHKGPSWIGGADAHEPVGFGKRQRAEEN